MNIVYYIAAGMLLVAGALAVYRMTIGPTNLDRVGANDVLVTVVIGGIALAIVYSGSSGALPILLVLALIGFVGSVSVARFMAIREGRDR